MSEIEDRLNSLVARIQEGVRGLLFGSPGDGIVTLHVPGLTSFIVRINADDTVNFLTAEEVDKLMDMSVSDNGDLHFNSLSEVFNTKFGIHWMKQLEDLHRELGYDSYEKEYDDECETFVTLRPMQSGSPTVYCVGDRCDFIHITKSEMNEALDGVDTEGFPLWGRVIQAAAILNGKSTSKKIDD